MERAKKTKFVYRQVIVCSNCLGYGTTKNADGLSVCQVCEGSGRLMKTQIHYNFIRPFVISERQAEKMEVESNWQNSDIQETEQAMKDFDELWKDEPYPVVLNG